MPKLVCTQPWLDYGDDMLVCRWTFPEGGVTARFRAKERSDWYAILHPSTKQKGKWQLTDFDDRGPIGDVIRATPEQALEDAGIDGNWELEEVMKRNPSPDKVWPYIGDVAGLQEEMEEAHFDESNLMGGWRRGGRYLAVATPAARDYRYEGHVLTISYPDLIFKLLNRWPDRINNSARTYGTYAEAIDDNTIRFYTHPDAEHHKPMEVTPELMERLAEIHLKEKQKHKGGRGIEVEEAPPEWEGMLGKRVKNPVGPNAASVLYRSVSPWEMAEILSSRRIVGRRGAFAGDQRAAEECATWFSEETDAIIHSGEDYRRYFESMPEWDEYADVQNRLYRALDRVEKKYEALPQFSAPRLKLRGLYESTYKLDDRLRNTRIEAISDCTRQAREAAQKLPVTSYLVEIRNMPGGTAYSGTDSSQGTQQGVGSVVEVCFPASAGADLYEHIAAIHRVKGAQIVGVEEGLQVRIELPKFKDTKIRAAYRTLERLQGQIGKALAGVT